MQESTCREIVEGAPSVLDALDQDCREHFEKVQAYLSGMGIPFVVDPGIVRGLDYYTRTVFELSAMRSALRALSVPAVGMIT